VVRHLHMQHMAHMTTVRDSSIGTSQGTRGIVDAAVVSGARQSTACCSMPSIKCSSAGLCCSPGGNLLMSMPSLVLLLQTMGQDWATVILYSGCAVEHTLK
jgi:hypothetical protein